MTAYAQYPLTLTLVRTAPHELSILLEGDLDYASADEFTDTATAALSEHEGLRDLRIDCAELGLCDSSGLSALLVLRRRAAEKGVRIRLDRRGPALDRLLSISGTLPYLTGDPETATGPATG
ncbi:STAS domain-containing protein [Nonomuraea pusilla]|uniref:STAS domain-containing protein n=1 Tax=Nonomuraea pusilla TaxID=46177 RepID=UPI0033307922